MNNFKMRLVVFSLLFVLLLPLYVAVAQAVNVAGSGKLVDSFVLKEKKGGRAVDVFGAGDTLVVVAESRRANSYSLRFYDGSSLVLVLDGEFDKGRAEAEVSLTPPKFSAGRTYLVCLQAFSYNDPIPGAFSSDSVVSPFSVTSVETKLQLIVDYDALIGDLYLGANLTTVNDNAVASVFVNFFLQLADEARATVGWVPVGSAESSSSGRVKMCLAFSLPSGNYRVKAVFEGNANYGRSENLTEISIASSNVGGSGSESSFLDWSSQKTSLVTNTAPGDFSLVPSNSTPYALMTMSVEAEYFSDILYNGTTWMAFFLDCVDGTGFLSSSRVSDTDSGGGGGGGGGGRYYFEPASSGGDPVVEEGGGVLHSYAASLLWAPNTTGFHYIIAGVLNGSSSDLDNAIQSGEGFLALQHVLLWVKPCPTNIVLNYPGVFYGNVFPVEAVISMPQYDEGHVDDFFTTTILAPRFSYCGSEYVVDKVIESVPLEFYLNNSSPPKVISTDANGLAVLELNSAFESVNLRVLSDEFRLYANTSIERTLTLGKIGICHTQNPLNDDFSFNFTVNGGSADESFYVGVDSRLRAEVGWLNQCVWNLPTSIVYAKSLRINTLQFPNVSIPGTSDYLRVGELSAAPQGTFVYDNHYAPEDVYLVFDSGQTVYPDSRGFACIPSGATRVAVYNADPIADYLEFFRIGLNVTLSTGDLGEVSEVLSQAEIGRHMVQLRLPQSFGLMLLNSDSGVSCVGAQTNLVGFFNVVKGPVYLSLASSPSNIVVGYPVDLIVDAVDGDLSEPTYSLPIRLFANEVSLGTVYTNSTGVAVLSWIPTSNIVYDVVANYDGNAIYSGASANLSLDLRTLTDMRLWLIGKRVESTTLRIHVNADAQVFSGANDTNYGSGYTLLAGTDSSANIYRSFLRFSLSSLEGIIGVSSARLLCWADTVASSPSIQATEVSDDSWIEGGITWNNQPSHGDSIDTVVVDSVLDYTSWDVTAYVQEEVSGDKTASFALLSEDEKAALRYAYFYSKEEPLVGNGEGDLIEANDNPDPFLEVTYTHYVYYRDREILDNAALNVDASTDYRFSVEGLPVGVSTSANIYVNGSLYQTKTTDQGSFTFDWRAEQSGICYFNVSFGGTLNYKPSDVYFVAMVQAAPATVLFEVLPHDFAVPSSLTLRATVRHASTGQVLVGHRVDFYKVDANGVEEFINHIDTDSSGVASLSCDYNGGIYAFKAVAARQMTISSGTILTAGRPTSLDLSMSKDASSYMHYVSGTLRSGTIGVAGQAIKIYVNDTLECTVTTIPGWEGESIGAFYKGLNLQPLNNQPTLYRIMVSYEGSFQGNATAYATTPDGTRCAVCTTTQYGYKPVMNSTVLRVAPQSTEATQPTKTPEQMQAEAEQSGWLTEWHEFSWWYPWYRLHYVSLFSGSMEFDMGMSVLPFADTVQYAESLLQRILELLPRVSVAIASAIIGAEFTALVASNVAGPIGFLLALGISSTTKLLTLTAYWNSVDGLISTYIGLIFSTILSLVKAGYELWVDLLKLLLSIKGLAEFGWGKLYSIISVPVNILFLGRVHQRLHDLGVLP